jgi:excisionase family DNA binding protein
MSIQNNTLLKFNSEVLLNKREVIDSFEAFIEHHRQKDNGEAYSEEKRYILLELCDEFLRCIRSINIPTLIKPWYCYEYSVTNDSIRLELRKYEDVLFDADGYIESATSTLEYILAEVKCKYLTVEEFAKLYKVTTITVRQWIRRGKLRTAKKVGRDWMIPELAASPKRGFESVTYLWEDISEDIIGEFPILKGRKSVYIYQNDIDKKTFHAIVNNGKKVDLNTQEREKLELMLISSPDVEVETLSDSIQYIPDKKDFEVPLLANTIDKNNYQYEAIFVKEYPYENVYFEPKDKPGFLYGRGEPEEYILPVFWEFFAVPKDNADMLYDISDNADLSDCNKIGTLQGNLILCGEMISDDYEPLNMCDDLSSDLERMMSIMISECGPLNDEIGDPFEDVFYIDELNIENGDTQIKSRILQELPYLCKKLMHIKPDIIAYYISDFASDDQSKRLKAFYKKNGFQNVGESNLMYAYTE